MRNTKNQLHSGTLHPRFEVLELITQETCTIIHSLIVCLKLLYGTHVPTEFSYSFLLMHQVFSSGNKLTISNTWEKIMHGFDDLTSIEHLHFTNSWHLLPERFSISILEELTIWGCMHIPLLSCLPALTSLQSLVIKDCPTILVVTDQLLPRTLNSLVVDSCEDLRRLQLAQQNRDALEVLQIVNCPRLTMVEGLNCIFFPKFLTIEQCPQLLLPHSGS